LRADSVRAPRPRRARGVFFCRDLREVTDAAAISRARSAGATRQPDRRPHSRSDPIVASNASSSPLSPRDIGARHRLPIRCDAHARGMQVRHDRRRIFRGADTSDRARIAVPVNSVTKVTAPE